MSNNAPSLGEQAWNRSNEQESEIVLLSRRISRIERFLKFRKMKQHSDPQGKVLTNDVSILVGDSLEEY